MLLALETSAERGSVALFEGDRLLGEVALDAHERHAASLLVCLDRLLGDVARSLDDVDRIALAIGPGSFTGLRIGLATALGLAFGTSRTIVPVPTLAALATQAGREGLVAAMLDARRGEVYAGLYGADGRAQAADSCGPVAEFLARLPSGEAIAFIGEGALVHRVEIEAQLGGLAHFLPPEVQRLGAATVGRLGLRLAAAGLALAPERVELRYLRRSEAEVRRAEAEARRLALHPAGEPIP
jgi:tRNA threonylcarbamoyladenosine biosynthesis protein TsaB